MKGTAPGGAFVRADGARLRRMLVGSGGDPCGDVAPGNEIDQSNRTPDERTKIEAQLPELTQVCIALGEIPG